MNVTGAPRRASIGALIFNVALVHAAGLVLLNQYQPASAKGSTGRLGAQVVQMRLAQATLPTSPAQSTMGTPMANISEATPTAPADVAPLAPLLVDSILAGLDLEPGPSAQASGSEYIPRPQLSTAPRPSVPVVVPFPKEITTQGRYTTILALFIDENGIVRRVRIDGPSLPKPMEDAARDTFLQAHFQPGEVQGQQVKSLIRVEVVFDNTPIEAQALPQS
jgi:hypothetical protein